MESVTERIEKRLKILRRLAGCLWGCSRATLNQTYKTFISYCCEVLITAPRNLIEKLETVQNQVVRLIIGAVKTTPIDAKLLFTNKRPIEVIIKEKALLLYEKLMRIGIPFWNCYRNDHRNLKTQDGFLQKVMEIRSDLELENETLQRIMGFQKNLDLTRRNINLDLI